MSYPKHKDLQNIKQRLVRKLEKFLNPSEFGGLKTEPLWELAELDLYFGIYGKLVSPTTPYSDKKIKKRLEKLGIKAYYAIYFDNRNKVTVDPQGRINALKVFNSPFERDPAVQFIHTHDHRADLAEDNRHSLEQSKFGYVDEILALSPELRRKNFATSLTQVSVPDKVKDIEVEYFHVKAATRATYADLKSDEYEGYRYYPKWKNPNRQEFSVSNLSDIYIQQNFWEPVLKENEYYLLIRVKKEFSVFKVIDNTDVEFYAFPIIKPMSGTSDSTSTPSSVLRKAFDLREKDPNLDIKAILFFSWHGGVGDPESRYIRDSKASRVFPPGTNQYEQIVDPKCMVKEKWGLKCSDSDPIDTKNWEDWDWFATMTNLYFNEPIQKIYFRNSVDQSFRESCLVNLKKLIENDMAEGPLKNKWKQTYKVVQKHKNVVIVPRGISILDKDLLFLGFLGESLYFRNILTGGVVSYSDLYIEKQITLKEFSRQIYEATKGLIPIIKAVTILATIVVTAPVVGTSSLVSAGVGYAKNLAISEASKNLVKDAYQRFRKQMLAIFIEGILSLFPKGEPNTYVNKVYRLILGFFKGYGLDTVNSLIEGYQKKITSLNPSYVPYVHWYFLYKRIEGSIFLLAEKLDQVKRVITLERATVLANTMTAILSHLKNGMVLFFSCLYLMEYQYIDSILEIFSDFNRDWKKPGKSEWEMERKRRIKKMLDDYHNILQKASKTSLSSSHVKNFNLVDDTRESSKKNIYLEIIDELNKNILVSEREYIFKTKEKDAHLSIVGMITLVGGLENLVNSDFEAEATKALKIILKLLKKTLYSIPFVDYNSDECEEMGQILGHVFGVFSINRAIFDENSSLGKFVKRKKGDSLIQTLGRYKVKKTLSHSIFMPIIDLVFSHIVILFERYKSDFQEAKEDILKAIIEELNEILLGAKDKDLAVFQTDREKKITFARIYKFLMRIDVLLVQYLYELSSDLVLEQQLSDMSDWLSKGNSIPPDKDFFDKENDDIKWARSAYLFIRITYFHQAIRELNSAFKLLVEPVATDFRISDLLKIISIEIEVDEADEILQYEKIFNGERSKT